MEDFDPFSILIDTKSHENILIYNISYKSLIDSLPLRIRFDKIDGFIRGYDGIRYLVLTGSQKHDSIYNRTGYFISVKSDITYKFSQNYAKVKADS